MAQWTTGDRQYQPVGGFDGTEAQILRTDTGGRVIVGGSGVADGAAVSGAGAPTLVAGQDGTNVQTILTHTDGSLVLASRVGSAGATRTRPADTAIYAVGDHIGNSTTAASVTPLQFTVGRVVGGTGKIIGSHCLTDAATTAIGAIRLHLFNTTPFAAAGFPADNDAIGLTYTALSAGSAGAIPNYIGSIDFNTWRAHTTSGFAQGNAGQTELAFACAAASQVIFGLLEGLAIFTPASGQKIVPVLNYVAD